MGYLDHIAACNSFDPARYRPLFVAGLRVGWVRPTFARALAMFPDTFFVTDDRVDVAPALDSPGARTEAVGAAAVRLAEEGVIGGLRGEMFPVTTSFHAPALLTLDRGAVPYFGVHAYGVHVNGWRRIDGRIWLWIGRRSTTKEVAPGKLDNMVAGGQPHGLTLRENLIKEADEEAGIAPDLALKAVPAGTISYCMDDLKGAKPDTMFVFDLEVPDDFEPRNRDGELTGFTLMEAGEAARLIREGDDFKFNVNLVIVDFLIRRGLIDPDEEPDYEAIVRGLHR